MDIGSEMQSRDLAAQKAPSEKHAGRAGRLGRRNQFDLVRNNGTTVAGKYCVVNLLKTPPDDESRAAFSISRRYSKLAVERNRARRLFREVYRRISLDLPDCWVIFIPRHRMKSAKMDDVLEDAKICVRQILGE
ncbi:MAG: ribonuclease P protein component [Victivallales bacterium]|nr:ribonuclease P protein component [Victivallales bacterium]